jgi:hypothetical protein
MFLFYLKRLDRNGSYRIPFIEAKNKVARAERFTLQHWFLNPRYINQSQGYLLRGRVSVLRCGDAASVR